MTKTVEVDDDAYDLIMANAKFGESFSVMLRKTIVERQTFEKLLNETMTMMLQAITMTPEQRKEEQEKSATELKKPSWQQRQNEPQSGMP